MISFLRRHRKALFIAVIVIFLLGTFVGLGGYLLTSKDTMNAVASVGSEKIPYSLFLRRVNQYVDVAREKGVDVTDAFLKEIKQEMLRDMIVEELLAAKADELGLVITDEDLARDIRNTPAFQREGQFNEDLYFQTVHRVYRDTPQAYEAMRRKTMKTSRLKQMIFQAAKLSPEELREIYARANQGSLADFDKKKEEFEAKAQQQRAVDLINHYLRQISAQVEVRQFLDAREAGT